MTCLCDTHLTTQGYSSTNSAALRITATELIQFLNTFKLGPIKQTLAVSHPY